MSAAFGRYRLLQRLGQGGMAEVFKAKSFGVEGFEKVLVIKRILPELAKSQEFVDMFIHEAKLAVRLSHANIVQVFDLGRAPLMQAPGGSTPPPAGDVPAGASQSGERPQQRPTNRPGAPPKGSSWEPSRQGTLVSAVAPPPPAAGAAAMDAPRGNGAAAMDSPRGNGANLTMAAVMPIGGATRGGPAAAAAAAAPAVMVEPIVEREAYFMAMEYVHGFDLASLLHRCRKQQTPLPVELAVIVSSEVAKGLDHAHRRRDEQSRPLGIVHRDVSPQNVLLSFEGEVKVTDFGIAKARGALEGQEARQGKIQGKFGYMSPEQARGDAVDARSDIFSLGVVLYECIAGVNPFSAPTTFETLRRVQACEYPPVELLRPEVPGDLVSLLRTAMARDPAQRFQDAGRFHEALLAFLYAHGNRSGTNDLAEFIGQFRGVDDTPGQPSGASLADEGTNAHQERTPVHGQSSRQLLAATPFKEPGPRSVSVERVAEAGERREITALALELPTRDARADRDRAAAVVQRYGGRLVSGESEQLVALFGLDDFDGRDTEVATRCALVILRMLDGGPRRAGVGLHSGRVHVTSAGTPTEDERLAGLIASARELSRAREGSCAISPAAARQVRGLFELESFADPNNTGVVSGSVVKDVRSIAETFGRFVGRKDELKRIGEVLASATKRRGRVLTLRGDNGIGKTRLLYEVERRLRKGGYDVGLYVCVCPPRGREIPFSGIVAMLQVLCGVTEGDSQERLLAVQPRLRALGLSPAEVAAVLSVLGANVPSAAGSIGAVLRGAFTRMASSLSKDRPQTFAWDAAHCMDEASLSLLDGAMERLGSQRVVLVFTARAGFSHPLERHPAHVGLDLSDLAPEDATLLVAKRLGVDTVPDELARFVRERAGGHPLFIEEVLKGLVDARAIAVSERQVVHMRLLGQELALPKTLRGLVASRVTRLTPGARSALQAAAILGDAIDPNVLARMLDRPLASLDRELAVLQRQDLLVYAGPSELRFTSPIVRDVVVDALPIDANRDLHAAAGHAYETVLQGRAHEHAARIAGHFYEAGNRERAAEYFAKSGERRMEARQLEAAARDYARALELCDVDVRSPHELAPWFAGLASAVRVVRTSPEARETCDRVVARVDETGDDELRVRVRIDAGRILGALHLFDAARARFAEAEAVAGSHQALLKSTLSAGAELAARQGDFSRSHQLLERVQRLVVTSGDRQEEHKVLCGLAQSYSALGDRNAALQSLERAEAVLPGDATAACERMKIRSLIEYFARDFRASAQACERALDMARELGVPYEMMVNFHNLGDVLFRVADYPRAYVAFQQSLALCDEGGFERIGNLNRAYLAYLDGVKGEAGADGLLRQGIYYAEANEFTWDVLSVRALLAQLLQRRGEKGAARAEFERLRELARSAGNRLVHDDCEEALRALAS